MVLTLQMTLPLLDLHLQYHLLLEASHSFPNEKWKHQEPYHEFAERAIGRMKNFKILQSTLPIKLIKRPREADYTTTDKILVVCAALCNLHPRLIS